MHNLKQIAVGNIKIANNLPLVLIAGPCQMESKEHALYMAKAIKDIADSHSMSLI